jgi:hypothetical protein
MFVGSQIHIGQHWFPSLVDPAKASLCRQPVCAIHMHIYLWPVTCQNHSEPCATSLRPALQACSYIAFKHAAVKCCESTASPICLSGLLVMTACIRQHIRHSHMCSVHRQVQTQRQGTEYRILQQGSPENTMQISTTMTHGVRLAP